MAPTARPRITPDDRSAVVGQIRILRIAVKTNTLSARVSPSRVPIFMLALCIAKRSASRWPNQSMMRLILILSVETVILNNDRHSAVDAKGPRQSCLIGWPPHHVLSNERSSAPVQVR